MIAHVLAAPSKPEIAKSTRAGCVIPQVCVAKSTEGMKAAPFDSEFFQNRVQAAAQDVALSERLSLARAENVSAVPTKKSVLIETVEVAKPRRVGCQSHVYPFRLPAFLRASQPPNSGKSAS